MALTLLAKRYGQSAFGTTSLAILTPPHPDAKAPLLRGGGSEATLEGRQGFVQGASI